MHGGIYSFTDSIIYTQSVTLLQNELFYYNSSFSYEFVNIDLNYVSNHFKTVVVSECLTVSILHDLAIS